MKRIALLALIVLGIAAAVGATTPHAQASLFGGGKSSATPSPSPSPSALPTASPEPPSVAIPRLQEKLRTNPNDQQSMTELASEYLQINRPDISVQLTQHLLQAGDKTAQVYYLDGVGMEGLGNANVAVQDLEAASNLDPTNLGVLAQLADLYLKLNRPADAERVAKRAVTFNKTEPGALTSLGSVYAAEQKYDDARTEFEAAFALEPKSSGPIFQIATTYAQQNNIPMALQTIDRALMIDPKDLQALVFKADLYAKQHDDAKATAAYDDAVVAAPSDDQKVAVMIRKAAYFAGEKKDAEAVAIFQQITTQYPKIAAGFDAYGSYLAQKQQFGQASQQFQAALAVNKDDPTALQSLGQLALQNKQFSDAVGYLKHYTEVSPDAQGYALLGEAYAASRNFDGARTACSKSFEIQRSPATLSCVADADFELKNFKEAGEIFDALDKAAKGYLDQNPPLLYIAAKTYTATNQCAKASAAYKRLMPMIRKGSKDYTTVQKAATAPCGASSPKHSG